MGVDQHEAASQKPDVTEEMGKFMPTKTEGLSEGKEQAKEKIEKALNQSVNKIEKRYRKAVSEAKDYKEAEAKVKKAAEQLNKDIQSLNKSTAGLPKGYSKTYENALQWNNKKNGFGTFGVDYDLKISLIDGKLAATYLFYSWDNTTGSSRDIG